MGARLGGPPWPPSAFLPALTPQTLWGAAISGPPSPAALPSSLEGECGQVTASALSPNPRFYPSLFLTCPHEWSAAPDRGYSGGLGVQQ